MNWEKVFCLKNIEKLFMEIIIYNSRYLGGEELDEKWVFKINIKFKNFIKCDFLSV